MNGNNINAATAAARDSARQTDGKFGFQNHCESAVTLDDATLRRGVDLTGLTPSQKLKTFISEADFAELVNKTSGIWANRLNLANRSIVATQEDISQEGALEILEKLEKVSNTTEIEDIRGLTSRMIQHRTTRSTMARFNLVDRKARIQLAEMNEVFRQENQRSMTNGEHRALVEKIRNEWPDQRHRPSASWEVGDFGDFDPSIVRIDQTIPGSDREYGTGVAHGEKISAVDDLGVPADRPHLSQALEHWEAGGLANKPKARRQAWNALAEGMDNVPLVQQFCLSKRQADKHRSVMNKHEGGVKAAISDWEQAEDGPAVDALFAPFGDLSMDQQQSVVNAMRSFGNGDQPDKLWQSALGFADRNFMPKP